MKTSPAAALLLLCAATATAQYGAKPNNQYEYRFVAKLMTGIPEISSQYSGMGLKATLLVQAPAADVLMFKLRDTMMAELRNKQVDLPWHESFPMDWQPVTEVKQLLEQPWKVTLQKGKILELVVGGNEPENMVNIKKAIVQRWQMSMQKEVIAEFPSGKFFEDEKQPLYFEAEEESIGGLCWTGYTVTPILEPQEQMDVIRSFNIDVHSEWRWAEQDVPKKIKQKRFLVTKNIMHDRCQRRPIFQHLSPAPVHCNPNVTDCFNTNANSSTVIRYLLRGRRNQFEIEAVSAIGVHLVYPFQSVAEQLTAGTNQTLVLLSTKPITSPFPEPPQPRSLKLLSWGIPTRDLTTPERKFWPKPTLTDAPIFNLARPILPLKRLLEKVPMEEIKRKVLEMLANIDASFDQVPDPETRDTPGMINILVSWFNMMSLQDLEDVYGKIPTIADRNIGVMKKLFREAVAMSGTNPCIMMVKKWIVSKEVVGAEAATLIMFIPMHIKTPTIEILQELFKLLRNGIAANDEHLRLNSMLAFANTVNIACIRPASTRNAFPTTLFEEFCNAKTPQIEQQWVPFFTKRVTEDVSVREKMVVLKAMSMLQHTAVVPTLMDIATKKTENVHVRAAAIFAMLPFRWIDPVLVERIVKPIALDKTEWHEVRMAATTVLVSVNAPLATFQQLALSTWTESDQQICNFVSSFLEEAANMTDINVPWLREVREKARWVFRLARPVRYSDLWTRDTLVRSQIDLMMTTSQIETVVFKSPFDVSSMSWTGRWRSYNGLSFFPLSVSTKFTGIQNVIDFLWAPDSPKRINRFNRGSEPVQAALGELTEIKNLLKLVKRENEPLMVWLHATIMGSMDRIFTFDQEAIQAYLLKMRDADSTKYEWKNFQKIMNLVDHVVAMPTDVGVPMMLIRNAPAVLSVRGDITIETKKSADGNKLVRIDTKRLQPFVNVKMMSLLGAVNPLTMRLLATGVNHNIMMSLPITTSTEWDSKSKRIEMFAQFINTPNQVNLIRMETWPFTTAYDLLKPNLMPLRQRPDTKPVHFRVPSNSEMRIGKEMFGLDLMLSYRSEDDFGSIWDFFRKMSATSKLGNMFSVLPTIRPNVMKLALDTARATTQKLIISLARDTFRRHHTLETVNNPEAEPIERIEWLGDKAQYRDEKHAAVEKDARREVMKRARRVLQGIHTGEATGWTMVLSAMGMKERRMALKWLTVRDSSRLNTKIDWRFMMAPTEEWSVKRELVWNTHITWPRVGRTINEVLMSNMYAPVESTISWGVNDTMKRVATITGAMSQSDLYKMWATEALHTRECREMRNKGFEHAPVCEHAKIMASRLNRLRLDLDFNTEWREGEWWKNWMSWMWKNPTTNKRVSQHSEWTPSWTDAFMNFFVNRLAKFPWEWMPSRLSSTPNRRHVELEFNPFRKTWKLSGDNSKFALKVKDIRPFEFSWWSRTNGVYNHHNNFGLSVPFLPFLNTRDGLNAYEDSWDMRNRRVMGHGLHKCVIDERWIKTFDNNTFPVEMAKSCWHLIAGDCSEASTFAVLVKPVGSRRAVRIITSSRILELWPVGLDYHLRVDKKESRRLPVGNLVVLESATPAKEPEARILKWSADWLELELPLYQARLRILGPAVELMLEPWFLRNRACGICGDMNGEWSQDLVGPKRCLFFGWREFQAAYMADKNCQRDPLPNYGDDCIKVKREHWMWK